MDGTARTATLHTRAHARTHAHTHRAHTLAHTRRRPCRPRANARKRAKWQSRRRHGCRGRAADEGTRLRGCLRGRLLCHLRGRPPAGSSSRFAQAGPPGPRPLWPVYLYTATTRGRQHASERCAASAVRRGVHTSRLERRSLARLRLQLIHRAETYARRDEQSEWQRCVRGGHAGCGVRG